MIEAAEDRWRYTNGTHLVALVRTGVTFRTGCWPRPRCSTGRRARDQRARADPQRLPMSRGPAFDAPRAEQIVAVSRTAIRWSGPPILLKWCLVRW